MFYLRNLGTPFDIQLDVFVDIEMSLKTNTNIIVIVSFIQQQNRFTHGIKW